MNNNNDNKPIYCFIDDSEYELKLFKSAFVKQFPKIHFICKQTFSECVTELDGAYPNLFILDLYGRTADRSAGKIPETQEIQDMIAEVSKCDHLITEPNSGEHENEKNNEYLRNLFAIFCECRNLFSLQCTHLNQTPEFGIENLKLCKENYPLAAAVIYTRKGLFADAAKLHKYECDGIFTKLTKSNDKETAKETQNVAPTLMQEWDNAVKRHLVKVAKIQIANQSKFNKKSLWSLINQVFAEKIGHTSIDNARDALNILQKFSAQTDDVITPEALISIKNYALHIHLNVTNKIL